MSNVNMQMSCVAIVSHNVGRPERIYFTYRTNQLYKVKIYINSLFRNVTCFYSIELIPKS